MLRERDGESERGTVHRVRAREMPLSGHCPCGRARLVGTAYSPPTLSEPVTGEGVRAALLALSAECGNASSEKDESEERKERKERSWKGTTVAVAGKVVSIHLVQDERWCVCANCGRDWNTLVMAREEVV